MKDSEEGLNAVDEEVAALKEGCIGNRASASRGEDNPLQICVLH